jgi:hypothetical protein
VSLSVLLDVSHRRAFLERMVILAGHSEWSPALRSNTWTDPVTKTTILTPNPLLAAWRTNFTGDFRRLRRNDFIVGSGSADNANGPKWYDQNRGMNDGDWFICNRDTNDVMTTKDSWPVNQGMLLAWFAPNIGGEKFPQIRCGWYGDGVQPSVSLAFYSDGRCEVFRGGVYVGEGPYKGGDSGTQTDNDHIEVLIMPWRMREILVSSKSGTGVALPFGDLDDQDTGQVILPAGKFWVEVDEGAAQFQVAPIRYAASGYICSRTGIFRSVPDALRTVETFAYAVGSTVTPRLVEEGAIATDFVPDGVKRRARVRVDLSGGVTSTPYLLGARAGIAPEVAFTSNEPTEILCDLRKLSLDVPEDAAGLTLSLQFKPSTTPATTQFRLNASNRPLGVELGGIRIVDAVTEPPEYTLRNVLGGELIEFEARDYSKSLENYLFADEIPLDGMTLADAFRLVSSSAGDDPASMVLEPDLETFRLPLPDGDGRWALLIQVGDSAEDWMRRLHSDYCGSYFYGSKPTATGYVPHILRQSRGDESQVTIYQKIDDATIGGFTEAETGVYRSYKEHKLECEANVIHVTGLDPASGRPILVTMEDGRSIDPTIPVASRPDNWLGERRVYGFGDPAITSLALAERCCEELYRRLTWCRFMAEIESEMLFSEVDGLPVWRGDCITLDKVGVFRVEAFSVDFTMEVDGKIRRKASYTLEFMRPTD